MADGGSCLNAVRTFFAWNYFMLCIWIDQGFQKIERLCNKCFIETENIKIEMQQMSMVISIKINYCDLIYDKTDEMLIGINGN